MKPIHILSIDGGGIRGVLPAAILTEIENRTGKRICELFDIIAGTSTGGILAVGLTVPGEDGKTPKFTAEELGALYDKEGGKIFEQSFLQKVGSIGDNAFGHKNIEALLKEYFGDAKLSDALTQVIVTSYEIEKRKTFYFNSRLAKESASEDFLVREVARATSAAPTYFEPTKVGPLGNQFALVDGGVYANNPSMLAYVEAKTQYDLAKAAKPKPRGRVRQIGSAPVAARSVEEPFMMLSLGTGSSQKPYLYDDAKDWGLVGWVRPIVDILMQGVSETVDFQMRCLLPPRVEDNTRRYYRLSTKLQPEHGDMSDASPEMISALKEYAAGIIRQEDKAIDELCAQLTA